MTLDTPTPESLTAEAIELERLAASKEVSAGLSHRSAEGRAAMLTDAAGFREQAAAKRAKAERLRKASAK